jgi:molecular chaperone HscB
MTHFERLGLPRRFSVDAATVEREYLARSRAVHPDFHTLADASQQAASLEQTAALNEAYLTLKDPFRRADYLVRLLGGPSPQEEKSLDQAFLMEMMDFRERIEEASGNRDTLTGLEQELADRLAAIVAELDKLFTVDSPDLVAVRKRLNAAKTLQSLLRDLRDERVM